LQYCLREVGARPTTPEALASGVEGCRLPVGTADVKGSIQVLREEPDPSLHLDADLPLYSVTMTREMGDWMKWARLQEGIRAAFDDAGLVVKTVEGAREASQRMRSQR
jgi:hypothetical protein